MHNRTITTQYNCNKMGVFTYGTRTFGNDGSQRLRFLFLGQRLGDDGHRAFVVLRCKYEEFNAVTRFILTDKRDENR